MKPFIVFTLGIQKTLSPLRGNTEFFDYCDNTGGCPFGTKKFEIMYVFALGMWQARRGSFANGISISKANYPAKSGTLPQPDPEREIRS